MHWVDTNYTVYEDLIALAEVEQTDAATLSKVLKDVLLSSMLQLSKCRGQAYDGASNMSGHLNGLATCIQGEVPQAHYVHCLAHSLNLCRIVAAIVELLENLLLSLQSWEIYFVPHLNT